MDIIYGYPAMTNVNIGQLLSVYPAACVLNPQVIPGIGQRKIPLRQDGASLRLSCDIANQFISRAPSHFIRTSLFTGPPAGLIATGTINSLPSVAPIVRIPNAPAQLSPLGPGGIVVTGQPGPIGLGYSVIYGARR